MSTRGATVRMPRSARSRGLVVSRWPGSRWVYVGGVVVVMVAMLEPPRSALDRYLLGGRLGSACELHAEDAVGIGRLGLIGIQGLPDTQGSGEGPHRPLAAVVAVLGYVRLRLALAAERQAVAHDLDVEALTGHARAERFERDARIGPREVDRRGLAGQRPAPARGQLGEEVFHLALQAAHLLPGIRE